MALEVYYDLWLDEKKMLMHYCNICFSVARAQLQYVEAVYEVAPDRLL